MKYTLDPWVVRWESIQRTLLAPDEKKTYFVKFNVEGLLRGRLRQPHERVRHGKAERMDERKRHP